jgi:pseudomonalisin
MRSRWAKCAAVIFPSLLGLHHFALLAQDLSEAVAARPTNRISSPIDDAVRVALPGNRYPLARPEYEVGFVSPDLRMERMILTLAPDAAQRTALEALIADQHNPRSPRYHQWLTPESFGRQFGVSDGDLSQIVGWLRSHGLEVEQIPGGRWSIVFSGAVAQVESAFHAQIRAYSVGGERHYANSADPEIPQALAGVVEGVVALHDFQSKPAHIGVRRAPAHYLTVGGTSYLAPADFATIYDVGPLYQNSINGAGQPVAIVARCNIHLSDVQAFRSYFGLPANNPTVVVNGPDPGIVSSDEESEADLDVEWSGAVAQNSPIQLVVSASTTSDGVYLSAQYIVGNNLAPVMSMSFGLCEAALGSAGNSFLNSLWQQAAAQGITVLVAAGDSGAAGCDAASAQTAVQGPAVNGNCSTPYSVCVGGTEFTDESNFSLYWSATSNPTTQGSALQYIPEAAWNESGNVAGGSDLWSGGGGASVVYTKPAWQTGSGVPSDGMRDVPDVSLTAASHDGYLFYMNGELYIAGGTSASTPAFAGLMAMAVQKTGSRQGNANTTLYALASGQQTGGAAVFHDITTGNNSVPGVTGFNAGPGYDQATGLGSVDAALLVNHWTDVSPSPAPSLQVSLPSAVSIAAGSSANVNVTIGVSGGFSSVVALAASGLPTGVTASFSPASLAAPGSGVSTLTLYTTPQAAPGSYTVYVTASGGGVTQTSSLTLTITSAGGFTLSLSTAAGSMRQGTTATAGVRVSVAGGFKSSVALSVAGLPAGVTGTLTPNSFAAPGSGSSVLTLTASPQAVAGTSNIQITATGGGLSQTLPLALTVTTAPSFTLSVGAGPVALAQGTSATVSVAVGGAGGFNSAVTLSATGLPSGMTAKFSPASFAAPGSGASTLTLAAGAQEATGSHTISIKASGGGLTATSSLVVTVNPAPSFILSESKASVSVQQGAGGMVNLNVATIGGFNSALALSASGLPAGVTAGFSAASLAAPGSGASVLTLTATTSASPGTHTILITAAGGGVSKTVSLAIDVTPEPGFTLTESTASVGIRRSTSSALSVTVSGVGGFSSPVALSITGVPPGVTASFSPASFSGEGNHSSTLKMTVASGASTGSSPLTITAIGGGFTRTVVLTLKID